MIKLIYLFISGLLKLIDYTDISKKQTKNIRLIEIAIIFMYIGYVSATYIK